MKIYLETVTRIRRKFSVHNFYSESLRIIYWKQHNTKNKFQNPASMTHSAQIQFPHAISLPDGASSSIQPTENVIHIFIRKVITVVKFG